MTYDLTVLTENEVNDILELLSNAIDKHEKHMNSNDEYLVELATVYYNNLSELSSYIKEQIKEQDLLQEQRKEALSKRLK